MENKDTHTIGYDHCIKGISPFFVCLMLYFLSGNSTLAQIGPATDPITIVDGNTHCPYSDVFFTTPAVNPGTKFWRVHYDWTFQNGNPLTYSGIEYSQPGYPSPGPRNPGAINWVEEGAFTISLTVSEYNALVGGTLTSQVTYQVNVIIDATCCGTQLLPIPSLTGTQTILNGIYYMQSDLTIPTGHHLIINGTVMVEGDAVPNTGPGGTVNGYFFRVEQGATFEMDNGEVRAHCDQMWGGVEVEQDAKVEMVNSDFKDSFFGIHPNASNTDPYQIVVGDSRFFNNRQSITAEDIDGTTGDNYIAGSFFDCDPHTFLSPFEYNTGHNAGESFRMEYGVKLEGDIDFTGNSFTGNTFNNGLTGVQVLRDIPTTTNGFFVIPECNFYNNQIAGVYIHQNFTTDIDDSSFDIPSDVDNQTYQYEQYRNANFTELPEETVFGLASSECSRFLVDNTTFEGGSITSDPIFLLAFKRIGIYHVGEQHVAFSSIEANANDSRFTSLTKGVELKGNIDHVFYRRNDFEDNHYALFLDVPSTFLPSPKGNFTCNSFVKTAATEDLLTYGIYITDGTQMDDFGGIGGQQNIPPCGNGWPVNTDPLVSPGYPNTAEDPLTGLLDIFQWAPPSNWYSIYDENASSETDNLGYTYHAFDNEHVGDFEDVLDWPDDAVWPTSIIWRQLDPFNPLRGDENTCSTQPEIPFPSARTVAQTVNSLKEQELAIHPNPFSDEIVISKQGGILDLNRIQISDLNGRVLLEENASLSDQSIKVNTTELQSGIYLLQAIAETGEVSIIKLIKQ